MPRSKRAPIKVSHQAQIPGMQQVETNAWEQMRAALVTGLEDGTLGQAAGATGAAAIRELLDQHEDIAHALFSGGFMAAMAIVTDGIMTVVSEGCPVHGQQHGPGSRIGRA